MRRIAIILIFFQLIGCTQLPIVTTRPAGKTLQKTPLGNTQKVREFTVGEQIGALVLLVVGIPALFSFFIIRAHRVRTPKPDFTMAKIYSLTDRRDVSIIVSKIDNVDSTLDQLKRWYNARKPVGDTSEFDLQEHLLMRSTKCATNFSRLAVAREAMHTYFNPWLTVLIKAPNKKNAMDILSGENGQIPTFKKTLTDSLNAETLQLAMLLDDNPYATKEFATREVVAARVDNVIIGLGEMGYFYHLWDQLEGLYPRTDLNDS